MEVKDTTNPDYIEELLIDSTKLNAPLPTVAAAHVLKVSTLALMYFENLLPHDLRDKLEDEIFNSPDCQFVRDYQEFTEKTLEYRGFYPPGILKDKDRERIEKALEIDPAFALKMNEGTSIKTNNPDYIEELLKDPQALKPTPEQLRVAEILGVSPLTYLLYLLKLEGELAGKLFLDIKNISECDFAKEYKKFSTSIIAYTTHMHDKISDEEVVKIEWAMELSYEFKQSITIRCFQFLGYKYPNREQKRKLNEIFKGQPGDIRNRIRAEFEDVSVNNRAQRLMEKPSLINGKPETLEAAKILKVNPLVLMYLKGTVRQELQDELETLIDKSVDCEFVREVRKFQSRIFSYKGFNNNPLSEEEQERLKKAMEVDPDFKFALEECYALSLHEWVLQNFDTTEITLEDILNLEESLDVDVSDEIAEIIDALELIEKAEKGEFSSKKSAVDNEEDEKLNPTPEAIEAAKLLNVSPMALMEVCKTLGARVKLRALDEIDVDEKVAFVMECEDLKTQMIKYVGNHPEHPTLADIEKDVIKKAMDADPDFKRVVGVYLFEAREKGLLSAIQIDELMSICRIDPIVRGFVIGSNKSGNEKLIKASEIHGDSPDFISHLLLNPDLLNASDEAISAAEILGIRLLTYLYNCEMLSDEYTKMLEGYGENGFEEESARMLDLFWTYTGNGSETVTEEEKEMIERAMEIDINLKKAVAYYYYTALQQGHLDADQTEELERIMDLDPVIREIIINEQRFDDILSELPEDYKPEEIDSEIDPDKN
ncbi:hypothetical protein ACFL3T_02030 [Patescibacteria group bacterium]